MPAISETRVQLLTHVHETSSLLLRGRLASQCGYGDHEPAMVLSFCSVANTSTLGAPTHRPSQCEAHTVLRSEDHRWRSRCIRNAART